MKPTRMVRILDSLGRIVIPIELRKSKGIKLHDSLEIFIDSDQIILCKYNPGCVFCGEAGDTVLFHNKLICQQCKQQLKGIACNYEPSGITLRLLPDKR